MIDFWLVLFLTLGLPLIIVIVVALLNQSAREKHAEAVRLARPKTLNYGERILWEILSKQGYYIAFTNQRAFMYASDNPARRNEAPLDQCDLVATDVHRQSTGSGSRVYGYKTSYGSWESTSSSIGTLQCLAPLGVVFNVSSVADPHGVVRLFRAAKREYKAAPKIRPFSGTTMSSGITWTYTSR